MENKSEVINPILTSIASVPLPISVPEEAFVYVAVKGSLHANDCSSFGLGEEEIRAISKKYPGSGTQVLNGVTIKTNVLDAINTLAQLGYRVASSTGEAEITWTLQREV